MKYKDGQYVIYEGRQWIVYGAYKSQKGEVTYYLRRGRIRTTAKPNELHKCVTTSTKAASLKKLSTQKGN